jgi:hypothetical protein
MAQTDAEKQGLWNSAALFFFLVLCGTSVAIISAHGSARIEDLNAFDFALLGLATFRLIHLITYDKILDFIRLALMDSEGKPLKTATRGWRRLLCDVMGCIWCAGIWSALLLVTIYLVGSWGQFAVLVLAVAGVGSLLQIISKATAAQY